jgi:hypothetical protein
MSRSINVGALMMQHMDWENDCLKIIICKHKGDATGEGLGNMKHVYANPYNPDVCPILSLALLTFCKQRRANISVQQVFEGDKSENRFLQILKNVIDHMPVDTNLGASKKDLGSHSNRKGAISHVLSFGIEKGYMEATTNISAMTLRQSSTLLRKCFDDFIEYLYGNRQAPRSTEKLYPTLANRFYKKRAHPTGDGGPDSDSEGD